MNIKCRSLCILLIIVYGDIALAEQPGGDPLHSLLISPDLLIHHSKEIGLTDEQVQQIRSRIEKVGREVQEVHERANAATGGLAELLSADKVDEEAALKQLDEVLAIEKDQKRLHLRIMIQIRNELTAKQRQTAVRIQRAARLDEDLGQRIKTKLARVESVVQSRADAGQPPFDAVGLMQKFPELMQNGQVKEAEALLDRVIAMLGHEPAEAEGRESAPAGALQGVAEKIQRVQQRAQKMQQNGQDVSQIQKLMSRVPRLIQQGRTEAAKKLVDQALELTGQRPTKGAETDKGRSRQKRDGKEARLSPTGRSRKLYSPKDVRGMVAALKKQDVAWRRIEWKTCLLDGLRASSEQHKPIMLWIFIDRPIDDERC